MQLAVRKAKMDALNEKCKEACSAAESALKELALSTAELDILRAQLKDADAARPAADAGLVAAVQRAMAREHEAAAAVLETARIAAQAKTLRGDLAARDADVTALKGILLGVESRMGTLEEELGRERVARASLESAAQALAVAEQWGGRRGSDGGAGAAAEQEVRRLRGVLVVREEALAEVAQQLDVEQEQVGKLERQIMFQVRPDDVIQNVDILRHDLSLLCFRNIIHGQ